MIKCKNLRSKKARKIIKVLKKFGICHFSLDGNDQKQKNAAADLLTWMEERNYVLLQWSSANLDVNRIDLPSSLSRGSYVAVCMDVVDAKRHGNKWVVCMGGAQNGTKKS